MTVTLHGVGGVFSPSEAYAGKKRSWPLPCGVPEQRSFQMQGELSFLSNRECLQTSGLTPKTKDLLSGQPQFPKCTDVNIARLINDQGLMEAEPYVLDATAG